MMNNSEETGIMCITDSPEKLENKFKFEIKKIEEHIISQYKPKNNDQGRGDDGHQGKDKIYKYYDVFDSDNDYDDLHSFVVNSLRKKTAKYLRNKTPGREKDLCTRVWDSCYSNLYPNKVGYFYNYEYLDISEEENLIFKDTYYEHIQMLQCVMNVVEIAGPSTSATTNIRTKRERVRFGVTVLGSRQKFDVILKELREAGVSSIQNDPRNINDDLQPVYVFDVLEDESCKMKAYALMKSPFLTNSVEE